MNRFEFFVEVARRSREISKVVIAVAAIATIGLMLINTELSAVLAVIFAVPLVIYAPITIISGTNKIFLLHRFMSKENNAYVSPSIFSFRLIPQQFLVSLGLMLPVFAVGLMLGIFDTGQNQQGYESLLDVLVLFQVLVFWDYLIFTPLFKRLVS